MTKTAGNRILHNSFWFSIELALETVVFLGTSIAVARYLGPIKLGYFAYTNFFVTVITGAGTAGLSTATRKYMSEFIALDRLGTARAVYNLAFRYQLISSSVIAAGGLIGIALFGDHAYRLMSSILIISIVPGLMSRVPAQAFNAFEDVRINTLSAFGYLLSYVLITALTVYFRWDLVGIAAATLVGRTVEVFLRTVPLNKILRKLPLDELDHDLIVRIRRFCIQSLGIQLLTSIVWDRSELFFLKALSSLEQIGFYSISYTLSNNLLTIPRVLGNSIGLTLMSEAGRDRSRVASMVRHSCRFLLLAVCPMCFGAVAVMLPTVQLVYGQRYLGAIPTLMIAAILCMPRAFQWIPETLLRTADKQNRLLLWYCVTAVVNITLDYFFIRRYGAAGAAWGNGLSQCFGVVVIWYQGRQFYDFRLPKLSTWRITLASLIMALLAYTVSHKLPGPVGLVLAVFLASLSYLVLIRVFHGLEASDRERLAPMLNRLPASARRPFFAIIVFVTPRADPRRWIKPARSGDLDDENLQDHLFLQHLLMRLMGTQLDLSAWVYRARWHSHLSRITKWLYSLRYLPRAVSPHRGKFLLRGAKANLTGELLLTESRIGAEAAKSVLSLKSFVIAGTINPHPIRRVRAFLEVDPSDGLRCYISHNFLLIFFALRRGIPAVVHVAGSPIGIASLKRHHDGLLAASTTLPPRSRAFVPQILNWSSKDGFQMLTQTLMPGSLLSTAGYSDQDFYNRIDQALEPLLEFRVTSEPCEGGPDRLLLFEEFPHTLAHFPPIQPILAPLLSRLQAWQQRRQLAPILTHGDYWIHNLLFSDDGALATGIVDWEWSRRHGTPGLDALQLAFNTLMMERDRHLTDFFLQAWTGRWENEHLAGYIARVQSAYELDEIDIGYLAAILCIDEIDKRRTTGRGLVEGHFERLQALAPTLDHWLETHE